METLWNGFTLDTPEGTFPLSTDSMLLADFVRLGKDAKVLDLCSGCATLGILLCARDPGCAVTGVEISEAAHEAALQNIQRNSLQSRVVSICADVALFAQTAAPGAFTQVISNPPYFSGGPASSALAQARREDTCSLDQLIGCAAKALKWGGTFSLVHRPERLAQICALASADNLEPKRLCLVHHHPGSPISLILLECKKGAKAGLVLDELFLFDGSGQPTANYRRIYHL